MRLYHVSDVEIREPDVFRGRRNADFGQGFYLTPDRAFALRWAGPDAVLNEYELDERGLAVRRLQRDEAWFRCIFQNRRAQDSLDADVVIGPIANDTLFETFGIITSGYLAPEEALQLLLIGPEYTQVAVKSERAARQLRWLRAERTAGLDAGTRRREQEAYSAAFAEAMRQIAGDTDPA